uniref:Endo/exonuclease/phosphatase domain-containing protein n=1 Tax=Pristionchus pacificus TaxID=54126 RepID=A0A8R1UY59_PRIPA
MRLISPSWNALVSEFISERKRLPPIYQCVFMTKQDLLVNVFIEKQHESLSNRFSPPPPALTSPLLSTKVDKMMSKLEDVLNMLSSLTPSITPPSISHVANPLASTTRHVYEACMKAIDEKAEYAEKEKRAVIIGSAEESTPTETLKKDEKLVADLIKYTESDVVQKAFTDGKISHHRHPSDRAGKRRPIKISFQSKELRDTFLIQGSSPSSQLSLPLPIEALTKNLSAGKIIFGVRDYTVISYRTPCPLPHDYGNTHEARTQTRAADQSSTGSLSSTPLSSVSDAHSAAPSSSTRAPPSVSHVTTRTKRDDPPKSKSHHLSFLLSSFTYRIISLCETWLDVSDSDALLIGQSPEFLSFRNDRVITVDLHIDYRNDLPFRKIRIITVYRSPSSPAQSLSSFISYLTHLLSSDFPCIILGDFNLPHIDWLGLSSPSQNDLLDFVSDHHFSQFVPFPTRFNNFLDLVFCDRDIIHNVSPLLPISDHLSVGFELRIPSPPPRHHVPSHVYRLADWTTINSCFFNHDWTVALRDLNATDSFIYFVEFVNNVLDSCVPLSKPSSLCRYPRNVKILFSKSNHLARIAPNSLACHKMAQRFNSALLDYHCYLENRIVATSNSKAFYKFCSGKLKAPKSTPSAIINSSGATLLTNQDKCVAFSEFFCSAFTYPQHSPLPPVPTPSSIFDIPFVTPVDILIFTINNVPLAEPIVKDRNVEKVIVKDLGVHFSPTLSFSYHISKVVLKARTKMNLMFKSFHSKCPIIYSKAFTTFILPNIEYCSVIWNPTSSVKLTKELERVQRDFTRRLYSRCGLPPPPVSYSERLRDLKFTTLEQRRFVTDIVFLHSIIHKRYLIDVSSLLITAPLNRTLRNGHPLRISLPFLPHNSQSTLASRAISTWNSLESSSVALPHDPFRKFISSSLNTLFPT